jgi:predicted heme/steroid binding protein/uncharacterized membrane protein
MRYTVEELKAGDGREGRPILFAYEGKVYEVPKESKLWNKGRHMNRHSAGEDLTRYMAASPHDAGILSRVNLVGELATEPVTPPDTPPAVVAFLLARHAHPVSVHFPIALSVTAALFSVISLISDIRILELASVFNQIFAAVVMPFSTLTGYFSWRYNYQRRESFEFRYKIYLSVLLPVSMLGAVGLFGYQYFFSGAYPTGPVHGLYHVLVVTTAANALALGYLGGRVTFPEPSDLP